MKKLMKKYNDLDIDEKIYVRDIITRFEYNQFNDLSTDIQDKTNRYSMDINDVEFYKFIENEQLLLDFYIYREHNKDYIIETWSKKTGWGLVVNRGYPVSDEILPHVSVDILKGLFEYFENPKYLNYLPLDEKVDFLQKKIDDLVRLEEYETAAKYRDLI